MSSQHTPEHPHREVARTTRSGAEVVGRRAGRPPRFTASAVVDEAIRYADAHDLASLSMPKLAKQLGIGTMTLYGYVASKRDLLDRMAAQLFEGIRIPTAARWQDQMRTYFTQIRVAAVEHPSLPALLSTVRIDLTPIADDLEALLAAMHGSGVDAKDSLRVFDVAFLYTLGFVMRESPGSDPGQSPLEQWHSFLAIAEPGSHEALSRATNADDGVGRFESGLDRLIASAVVVAH